MEVDFLSQAFSPFELNQLTLKNRFVKTATYEGMTPEGIPADELAGLHAAVAKGDVALSTVAYGGVNNTGRTHQHQLLIGDKSASPLEKLVTEVHTQGGAVSIQLTHCGFFSNNRSLQGRPFAPSRTINYYGLLSGLGWSKAMNEKDLDDTIRAFVKAARLCKEIGFDAVELHLGHGYLLSQFLSPLTNKRKDEYGIDRTGRIKFPLRVVEEVRAAVGPDFPIICKVNLDDGFAGGWSLEDSKAFIPELEKHADAVVLSGGFTSRNAFYLLRGDVPRRKMANVQENLGTRLAMKTFGRFLMQSYPFQENFFQEKAMEIRSVTSMPLAYLGGITSAAGVSKTMEHGFDLVTIGRALIHDPEFVLKLQDGYVSPCNHCNECLVEMDKGGVKCVLNE